MGMMAIISPAKQMRCDDFPEPEGTPALLERAVPLLEYLRGLTLPELKKLLACNDRLAEQNYERYQKMELERADTAALMAYNGIQFRYMAPGLFTEPQLAYIQRHLRILSGFYGILRPLDAVAPYRLEMQARLKTGFCKNLYDYWGDSLCRQLEAEGADVILNLASEEYAKAVEPYAGCRTVWATAVFGELEDGEIREKGVYVKMARGEMVRFLAERQIEDVRDIRAFQGLGYRYVGKYSDSQTFVFLREKDWKRRAASGM